jgi:hypothetical protein
VRFSRTVAFSIVFLLLARAVGAQGSARSSSGSDAGHVRRLSVVTTGTPVTVPINIVTTDRPAGLVAYSFVPASGVDVVSERTGSLPWKPDSQRDLRAMVRLTVGTTQPAGRLLAGRLSLRWSDGRVESIDVWVEVRPLVKVTTEPQQRIRRRAHAGSALRAAWWRGQIPLQHLRHRTERKTGCGCESSRRPDGR